MTYLVIGLAFAAIAALLSALPTSKPTPALVQAHFDQKDRRLQQRLDSASVPLTTHNDLPTYILANYRRAAASAADIGPKP